MEKLSKYTGLWIILWLIRVPASLWGPTCRFVPTCSEYMCTAVTHWGVLRGIYLGGCRLLKCHPWYQGDIVDFVPDNPSKIQIQPGKD